MPFKHQTESYRTRNGKKFICEGDILDTANGDLKAQAKSLVKALKAMGRDAFYEKQDGYYRVFGEAS